MFVKSLLSLLKNPIGILSSPAAEILTFAVYKSSIWIRINYINKCDANNCMAAKRGVVRNKPKAAKGRAGFISSRMAAFGLNPKRGSDVTEMQVMGWAS